MKKYKVEYTIVDKKYRSITIEAKDSAEAISLAKQVEHNNFEESEEVVAHEWKTQGEWTISSILKNLFG